ncbi:uncharacterized protein EV154DRAFT_551845 [Mucor mucedo]|uniref:uncharacterized protein n=1 Tax=Mucor mucedo TaxID=29922 RepID=UPI00221FFE4B|nr:uncharacterized protein EV154DRAFT_551845 [Mucor mucedo]KAI7890973.1 hypothetical protein EV154DRAFT_551845 [Mucor mucedo]
MNSLAELQSLHEKSRMFLNSFYTDGYTCRVSFCKKQKPVSTLENVTLTLNNFNSEEIKQYFRLCTVDPNRKDVFTSYHVENDVRRISSSEYYNMNGIINRQRQELERKKSNNIEYIETRIPSPKTTGAENYKRHITYMLQHFKALVTFYDFQTARIRWSNYFGKQKATDHAISVLINGSTKYNKNRRKNTRRKKRKRRKLNSRYKRDLSNTKQAFKEKFKEGDKSKMPMIIFGDGLKNKSHVRFKGPRHGVIDKLYRQLKRRENLGELLLLDIDEYNTSKTCNGCLVKNLENLKCGDHKIHQILNCNNLLAPFGMVMVHQVSFKDKRHLQCGCCTVIEDSLKITAGKSMSEISKHNKLAIRMDVFAGSSSGRFTKKLFSFFHTGMPFPQSTIRHDCDQNNVAETTGIEDMESNVLLKVLLEFVKDQYDEDQV